MNALGTPIKRRTALAVILIALLCAPARAPAEIEEDADAASKLRIQDSAFSLLIESYRQLQNQLIQTDYENRLRVIATLNGSEARRDAIVLAKQERDLRTRKLCVQLASLGAAYDYSRRDEERQEGVNVPHAVNTDAAAKKLKHFVVLVPPADNSSTGTVRTIPAKSILRDKRPAS